MNITLTDGTEVSIQSLDVESKVVTFQVLPNGMRGQNGRLTGTYTTWILKSKLIEEIENILNPNGGSLSVSE